jgi:hypothetical protein
LRTRSAKSADGYRFTLPGNKTFRVERVDSTASGAPSPEDPPLWGIGQTGQTAGPSLPLCWPPVLPISADSSWPYLVTNITCTAKGAAENRGEATPRRSSLECHRHPKGPRPACLTVGPGLVSFTYTTAPRLLFPNRSRPEASADITGTAASIGRSGGVDDRRVTVRHKGGTGGAGSSNRRCFDFRLWSEYSSYPCQSNICTTGRHRCIWEYYCAGGMHWKKVRHCRWQSDNGLKARHNSGDGVFGTFTENQRGKVFAHTPVDIKGDLLPARSVALRRRPAAATTRISMQ